MRTALSAGLILAPIAIMAILNLVAWPYLPQDIAIHWNGSGQADGWGSKNSMWGLLLIYLVPALLVKGATWRPFADAPHPNDKAGTIIVAGIGGLFIAVHVMVILKALYPSQHGTFSLLTLGLGGIVLSMGFAFRHLQRNGMIGIRTPWTLASDAIWRETHRWASRYLIPLGLLMIVFSPVLRPEVAALIMVAALLGAAVYSWGQTKT